MANGCVQVFGFLLASWGLLCIIVATCVNEWKTHGSSDGRLTSYTINVGLWMECTIPSTSKYECTAYDPIHPSDSEILWTRAVMITSITLSVCGLIAAVLGMKCTLCLDEEERVKNKVAFFGGIFVVLSGLCAFGIVSWYANEVMSSLHDPSEKVLRFSLGKCLFLGWGGAFLSIIGGAFMACCSWSTSISRRSYTSPPSAQKTSGKDYV